MQLSFAALAGTDADTGGDLIPDDLDNCLLLANQDQVDVEQDGYGNRCGVDTTTDGIIGGPDFGIFVSFWLNLTGPSGRDCANVNSPPGANNTTPCPDPDAGP